MRTLKLLLTVQAVQLLAIMWVSLLVGTSAVPIKFLGIQGDFYDFHDAGRAVLLGDNPYENPRFNKPTSSLPLFAVAAIFPRPLSVILWFALNVWAAAKSLSALARRLNLDCKLVYAVALTYYPMMFAMARGNLDVLMLSLVLWSFGLSGTRKGIMIGLATALKLYTGLLAVLHLRRKRYATALAIIGSSALLNLCLPWLVKPAIRAIVSRGNLLASPENMGPSIVFGLLPHGKLIFLAFWFGTFGYKLLRDERDDEMSIIEYFPWMIAFPFLIYPYEAVFLLPLMMLYASRNETVSRVSLIGILASGFQAEAVASLFGGGPSMISLCHFINATGIILVIIQETLKTMLSRPVPSLFFSVSPRH